MTAVATFLGLLPTDLPSPEALLEDDGDIALEWFPEPCVSVSVSVREDGLIRWAYLIGEEKDRGRFMLPEWPPAFVVGLTLLADRT